MLAVMMITMERLLMTIEHEDGEHEDEEVEVEDD
jgi:hypothetical protein